jgi:hypothetical protein
VTEGNDALVQTLLAAAPTVGTAWQEHLDFWDGEVPGAYNDMSVLARHLVQQASTGNSGEVRSILQTVERLLEEHPTGEAYSLLVVGMLETIQNITSHADASVGSTVFLKYLGPRTAIAWKALHEGWGSQDT